MSVRLKDFYADWCGPCDSQDPIIEELLDEYTDVSLEKIDVEENREIANEYHVRSLPTVIVEDDDEIVDRFVGVTGREDLEAALTKAGATA